MRRRDAKILLSKAEKTVGELNVNTIEEGTLENKVKVYFFDGKIQLLFIEGYLIPTLIFKGLKRFPSILVDMGAVPYICNGADLMAPGVIDVKNNFNEDEVVVIRDIVHEEALAVGVSLKSSEALNNTKKGKVVQNLHYVGDKIWELIK
jgi:PUA domain protein